MNYPEGTKLTVGTVYAGVYSILIMPYTLNCRPAEFKAEVVVADADGNMISQFEMDGDEDWALRNACIKRIMTGEDS
jgi:hypothetical protein